MRQPPVAAVHAIAAASHQDVSSAFQKKRVDVAGLSSQSTASRPTVRSPQARRLSVSMGDALSGWYQSNRRRCFHAAAMTL